MTLMKVASDFLPDVVIVVNCYILKTVLLHIYGVNKSVKNVC